MPPEWKGETAVIIGGGPSLTLAQVRSGKRFRRIAVNDSFTIDAGADVVCWGDPEWWAANRDEVLSHSGYKITWRTMPGIRGVPVCLMQWQKGPPWLSADPLRVVGSSSGLCAVNIAALFGVCRILLIGFDMQPVGGRNNWHRRHQRFRPPEKDVEPDRYISQFIPEFEMAASALRRLKVEVINCTPGSALKCFPFQPIDKVPDVPRGTP